MIAISSRVVERRRRSAKIKVSNRYMFSILL